MKEYYTPLSKKYMYHIFYVNILSKNICSKIRSEGCYSIPDDILSVREYAEFLSTNFDLAIQSYHFGNGRSLSIEDCNIEFIDKYHNAQFEFHSHLSDDS